ncbi:MAG: peroxiredoxin [Verrucomicrobia bacterium]|nr:peroxiredoxin [Verrucomicrobiota bacterium]
MNVINTMLLAALMLPLLMAVTGARAAETPKAGDKAPLFEGKDQDGKTWKLADVLGKKLVLLYFYPKDDTPGCTKQACGLRDRMEELTKDKVEVVGVSFDSPESHQKFAAKYKLNFTLLADPEGKIVKIYGAKMPALNIARRVSLLIGLDGRIVHVTDTMGAATHLSEMKDAVAKLRAK